MSRAELKASLPLVFLHFINILFKLILLHTGHQIFYGIS